MSFRKNTSTNKLCPFALAAAFALFLASCGGGGGGGGGGGAIPMPTPEPAVLERNPVDVAPHPVFPVSASLTWEEVRIPTRQDVGQRLLLAKGASPGTKAVILFAGGNGTPISVEQAGGFRLTGNFLVRSSPLFASEGFITAIVDAPSDKPEGPAGGRDGGMDDAFRQSPMHLTDIRAVVDFLVSEGAREVFLIGTSRGTLSVAYLATRITNTNVQGYVLTASLNQIASYAGSITRPVLMAHHADDGCFVTTYAGAQATYDALANSSRKDFITVSGGAPPIDDNPCQARTAHGFLGKERETVAALVEWMGEGTLARGAKPTIAEPVSPHKAWLARFGRTAAEQVTEAIGEQMRGVRSSRLTLGGQDIGFGASPLPPTDADSGARLAEGILKERNREVFPGRGMSMREFLLTSSFHLASAEGKDAGGGWSLWGDAARSSFDAREGALSLDGDVTTATMGLDFERERWLAGVALSRSAGEGDFRMSETCGSGCNGELESTLTGAYPYARYRFNERLSAWGILGHGRGELTLTRQGRSSVDTDIEMSMAAIGGHGVLLPALSKGDFELALRSDALLMWASSEETQGLAETEPETSRFRLALEVSREFGLNPAASLTPSLEVGLRHDGGDAETGSGVELGGGLRYTGSGLTVQVNARGLLAHADSDYEEWGVSGSVRLNPGEKGRGLSMRLGSTSGTPVGGAEQLWRQRSAAGLIGNGVFDPGARLDAEVGYGLDSMGGLLTPYGGMSVSEWVQTYRVGSRFSIDEYSGMSLEGERHEGEHDVEHGITLRCAIRW